MKTILFDLDGTLLDTIGDLQDSVNYVLRNHGLSEKNTAQIRSYVGDGLRMLMKRSLPENSPEALIDACLSEMKAYYADNCRNRTTPYDGIMHLLQRLKENDFRMGIVSNKADHLVRLLTDHFFSEWITVAIGEQSGIPRKPAPEMLYMGLQQLRCDQAWYIGDSEVDIQTAKAAGLPCLSVAWGFRSPEQLRSAGASELIFTPEELFNRLLRD